MPMNDAPGTGANVDPPTPPGEPDLDLRADALQPRPVRTLLDRIRNVASVAQSNLFKGMAWASKGNLLRLAIGCLAIVILVRATGTSPVVWWRTVSDPDGLIFVDSPEVYTRERLINERLDEDTWLAARLKEADSDENLAGISRVVKHRLAVGGDNAVSAPEGEPPVPPEKPPGVAADSTESEVADLTFDQKVRLKSANRDFVLKRIIENRLDDRHDLEGNSLYILKFDTTVISNQLSKKRALVEVHISPPVAFPENTASDTSNDMPLAVAFGREDSLDFMRQSFRQFVNDTSDRLNNAVAKAYAEVGSGHGCTEDQMDACIRKYAALSFGVVEKDVVLQTKKQDVRHADTNAGTTVPQMSEISLSIVPFADYLGFVSLAYPELGKSEPPAFFPSETSLTFDLRGSDCADKYTQPVALEELKAISPRLAKYFAGDKEGVVRLIVGSDGYSLREADTRQQLFKLIEATFPPPEQGSASDFQPGQSALKPWGYVQFLTYAKASGNSGGNIERLDPSKDSNTACRSISGSINIGFLRFATKVRQYNTYSYSVLPRESVVSAINEVVESSALRLGGNGEGGLLGSIFGVSANSEETSKAASLQARVTSFSYIPQRGSDGGQSDAPDDDRAVAVGWIINPMAARIRHSEDDLVSTSESVMAIVSVPSWWPYLDICIERHWLSTGGTRYGGENCNDGGTAAAREQAPTRIRVDLPYTQQLIESSLIGQERRTPRIEAIRCEWSMLNEETKRRALRCIITGKRLWRNTVVTFGTLRHSNLTVMPNMEGLVVDFEKPENQNCDGVTLSVWTSEGVAQETAAATGAPMEGGSAPFTCTLPKQETVQNNSNTISAAEVKP